MSESCLVSTSIREPAGCLALHACIRSGDGQARPDRSTQSVGGTRVWIVISKGIFDRVSFPKRHDSGQDHPRLGVRPAAE